MKKTVLITGASSGIGHASAKLFANCGWNVVATMRTPAREAELAALSDLLVTRLDVQDRDSIRQTIESGTARFGRIDALINNAGFSTFGVFEGIAREKVQEQFGVVNRSYPILIRIGAIERLSEDIDLSVSPAFLGINEELVEQADGQNKRTEWMKELEEACIERVRDQFLPELERIANEVLVHRSGGAAWMEFQVDTRIKGWGIQEEKFFAPQSILPRFSALARLHQMLHSADSHQPHSVHEPVTSFP
jgi:hypothetical protein